MTRKTLPLTLLLTAALWNADARGEDCPACDEAIEMTNALEAYAQAWRDNDADAVIVAFAENFTLSPGGMPFVEGAEAAREFWWPSGAPTARITAFRFEPIQSGASGSLGYVRGHYEVEFEYEGSLTAMRGKFLSILERGSDGWKIKHHYWDSLPADSDS